MAKEAVDHENRDIGGALGVEEEVGDPHQLLSHQETKRVGLKLDWLWEFDVGLEKFCQKSGRTFVGGFGGGKIGDEKKVGFLFSLCFFFFFFLTLF